MALPAHVVHAACGLGIEEGTRPELVEFGVKNLAGVNVRMDTRGMLGKRYGYTALSALNYSGSAPASSIAQRLIADRDTIVRFADREAHAYSATATRWRSLGRAPEAACRLIEAPTIDQTTGGNLEDIALVNGYIALGHSGTLSGSWAAYVSIIDEATGAVVRAPEVVGSSTAVFPPTLAVQGNNFIMARLNTAGTAIDAFYLDTTSPATINTGWVAFGASLCTDAASGRIDLHSLTATNRVALLYQNNSGGTSRLTLLYFTTAGVTGATVPINTNSTTPAVWGLGGSSTDTCWLAWSEGVTIAARGQDPATAGTTLASKATIMTMTSGAASVHIVGSETAAGKARVIVCDTAAPIRSCMRGIQTSAGVAATDGSQVTVPSAYSVRKGFHYGSRYYGFFQAGEGAQNAAFVCDFTDDVTYLRPISTPAPGLASTGTMQKGRAAASASGSTLYYGFEVKRSGVANGSVLAALDFTSRDRWQPAAHGNSTFLSGGLPSYCDGLRVAEVGFLLRPNVPTIALGAGGITGTFRYVAVYEEVDADGNWHVSGLSTPSASTSPAGQTPTVTTSPLSVSARIGTVAGGRSVRVAWYRTLTGGVAPYYRLGTTVNDTSALTVTFVDTVTDATLGANSKLYSQPGVVGTAQDRRPPPPFQCVATYNGMLVGASGSDVWYSGQQVSGEGVWFNPIFQVPVPGEGDITAMWVMDGALFVAKRRDIYAISGEAPSDNGASGGLGLPRRLAVDLGCIDQRSVCVTALGTFLQTERGLEIFTRAQTLEWIGQGIQTTLAAFPIITSAVVEPASATALFELAPSTSSGIATSPGRTLVYDLSAHDWISTDTHLESASQSACMIYTGSVWRYAWMTAAGVVYCEDRTTYLDAGAWVTASYETAWLKHGLQQEQRVWDGTLLFERESAAGVLLETAYDYAAYSSANNKTWTEAETLSGLRQLEWRPKSRGTAMKFRVSDATPAVLGTGQGLTFIGMSFDTAPKQGAVKGVTRLDPALRK